MYPKKGSFVYFFVFLSIATYLGPQRYKPPPGLGLDKNMEIAGVDDLVVYIQTAVFYSSLHIHHQMVHTSHFPIFSRPKPGGGVYLWGPHYYGKLYGDCPRMHWSYDSVVNPNFQSFFLAR